MKEIRYSVAGVCPLLMHNNQMANPFNGYCRFMKPLTAKRKKTDRDFMEIARVEWEAGIYIKNGVVVIPAENIEKCLLLAARRTKNGKKYEAGAMVLDDYCELKYKGPTIKVKTNGEIPNGDLDPFYEKFRHQAMVKVGNQTVLRTRPVFHDWSFEFTLMVDESVLDDRTVISIIEDAGRFVGLCEKRPRLGRFVAKEI